MGDSERVANKHRKPYRGEIDNADVRQAHRKLPEHGMDGTEERHQHYSTSRRVPAKNKNIVYCLPYRHNRQAEPAKGSKDISSTLAGSEIVSIRSYKTVYISYKTVYIQMPQMLGWNLVPFRRQQRASPSCHPPIYRREYLVQRARSVPSWWIAELSN